MVTATLHETFIRFAVFVWICFLCSSSVHARKNFDHPSDKSGDDVKRKKPNFVVFFMDDLGYGDLGFNGHPTTKTPNLDKLAWNGKILTTWYSGCSICTGSRAALMTGRQFPRTGIPGVLGPTRKSGLPLNETTIAEQLKGAGYATGIVGKWHLGQRQVYLPANRGFDYYLGIPYSDDMGRAIASACPGEDRKSVAKDCNDSDRHQTSSWSKELYQQLGLLNPEPELDRGEIPDPASDHLPLVYQNSRHTKVVEQPLDFTTLALKYNDFATKFIEKHKDQPFFLYVPFSHVHAADGKQPEHQYAGCAFKNSTSRGPFGDALAEADWIVGNIIEKLKQLDLEEDTLILFSSDNGPWLGRGLSGGSEGLFTGRYAGYYNTGKGSTWEGGIRMPAFAYWKGKIKPFSRSAEIVSSLDVFPTLSTLAGVPLPSNRVYDGRDFSDVLFDKRGGKKRDFLFFYGTCHGDKYWSVAAVRHGKYKAHWCTAPGLGHAHDLRKTKIYDKYPLLFDVEKDPSEASPISTGDMPKHPEDRAAMHRIMKAYAMEKATFKFGNMIPEADGPGEGPGNYGICCDRAKKCNCKEETISSGILNVGTKQHHDLYHEALGHGEPNPPRTHAQEILQRAFESKDKVKT